MAEVTPEAVEPEKVETEPEAQVDEPEKAEEIVEPEASDDPTIEPGGDDPKSVYLRRRAREIKQAREEAERERQERLRLEGELRALRETAQRPAQPPQQDRIYTIGEVDAAYEAGKISREERSEYINRYILPAAVDERLKHYALVQQQQEPIRRAAQDIEEFKKIIPNLQDTASDAFQKTAKEFQYLTSMGLPNDQRTTLLAIERAHGSLSTYKRKQEIAGMNAHPRQIPVDGQGVSTSVGSGKVDISKAPETMKADWERDGVDRATRERRYRIYLDLKQQQGRR